MCLCGKRSISDLLEWAHYFGSYIPTFIFLQCRFDLQTLIMPANCDNMNGAIIKPVNQTVVLR